MAVTFQIIRIFWTCNSVGKQRRSSATIGRQSDILNVSLQLFADITKHDKIIKWHTIIHLFIECNSPLIRLISQKHIHSLGKAKILSVLLGCSLLHSYIVHTENLLTCSKVSFLFILFAYACCLCLLNTFSPNTLLSTSQKIADLTYNSFSFHSWIKYIQRALYVYWSSFNWWTTLTNIYR